MLIRKTKFDELDKTTPTGLTQRMKNPTPYSLKKKHTTS